MGFHCCPQPRARRKTAETRCRRSRSSAAGKARSAWRPSDGATLAAAASAVVVVAAAAAAAKLLHVQHRRGDGMCLRFGMCLRLKFSGVKTFNRIMICLWFPQRRLSDCWCFYVFTPYVCTVSSSMLHLVHFTRIICCVFSLRAIACEQTSFSYVQICVGGRRNILIFPKQADAEYW